jgi:hypothetical protein
MDTSALWDNDTCYAGTCQVDVVRDVTGELVVSVFVSRDQGELGALEGLSLQDLLFLRDACDAVLARFPDLGGSAPKLVQPYLKLFKGKKK